MNKQETFKYEVLIPVIAAFLFFFTRKIPLPEIIYTVFALLAAIWYFPLRMFFRNLLKEENVKGRIVKTFVTFILAAILVISVVLMYNADWTFFKTIFKVLAIVNVFFLYYFHFKNKEAQLFFNHLVFMFFTPVVFV